MTEKIAKKNKSMPLSFAMEGGRKLHGSLEIKKSKNAAVSLLCASLLNDGRTTLRKVPKIEEVFRIIEVLQSIGMQIEWRGVDLMLRKKKISTKNINTASAGKT